MAEKKRQVYTGRKSKKEQPQDADVMVANTMTPAKKKDIPVICQKIRYYREKKGLEQKMLGAQIGVIGNAISNWENGKARPDIALLPKICDALDITLYDLFGIPAPQRMPAELETLYKLHAEEIQQILKKYYRLSPGHQFTVMALIHKVFILAFIGSGNYTLSRFFVAEMCRSEDRKGLKSRGICGIM